MHRVRIWVRTVATVLGVRAFVLALMAAATFVAQVQSAADDLLAPLAAGEQAAVLDDAREDGDAGRGMRPLPCPGVTAPSAWLGLWELSPTDGAATLVQPNVAPGPRSALLPLRE